MSGDARCQNQNGCPATPCNADAGGAWCAKDSAASVSGCTDRSGSVVSWFGDRFYCTPNQGPDDSSDPPFLQKLVIRLVVNNTVETVASKRDALIEDLARELGVAIEAVNVTITRLSDDEATLTFSVTAGTEEELDALKDRAAAVLGTPEKAEKVFGGELDVTTVPTIEVIDTTAPISPSGMSGGVVAAIVIGVLLVIGGGAGGVIFKFNSGTEKDSSKQKRHRVQAMANEVATARTKLNTNALDSAQMAHAANDSLPPNWTAAIDPVTQRTYYIDGTTGASQWQHPGALPSGWVSAVDPTSKHTYYKNAVTGAVQWEKPGALPSGWASAVDPTSRRTYYKNAVTGATQWEKPTAAAGAPADKATLPRGVCSQAATELTKLNTNALDSAQMADAGAALEEARYEEATEKFANKQGGLQSNTL